MEPEKPNFDFGFDFGDEDDHASMTMSAYIEGVMTDADKLIRDQVPENTRKKTKSDMKKIFQFFQSKNENRPLLDLSPVEMNAYLCEFFMRLNKEDGTPFEPSTYKGMRHSIERHLKEIGYPEHDLNSPCYEKLRSTINAKGAIAKAAGKGNRPNRAMPLTSEDEDRMWESGAFGDLSPKALLRALWWGFTTGFGLRGVDEHRQMKWEDVELKQTTDGTYLEYTERATKTRRGTGSGRSFKPKIFCTCEEEKNPRCMVELYRSYQLKREGIEHDAFYLAVNFSAGAGDTPKWYKNQPLGVHSISSLMKDAAHEAGLSGKRITNHSGRKTGVKRLLDENVSPQYIAQLTGHKSVGSLASYAEADIIMQKKMSKTIASTSKTSVLPRPIQEDSTHARPEAPAQSSSANGSAGCPLPPEWGYNFQGSFKNCNFYIKH